MGGFGFGGFGGGGMMGGMGGMMSGPNVQSQFSGGGSPLLSLLGSLGQGLGGGTNKPKDPNADPNDPNANQHPMLPRYQMNRLPPISIFGPRGTNF